MSPSSINIKDETVHTLRDTARTIKDDVRETANVVQDNLSAKAAKVSRKVQDFVHTAGEEISHAADTVNTRVHEKPVESTLIALGVGFILGALLRR